MLELYHEIRGDTFWRPSDHIVLKKTQLQYLKELQTKKQKELRFLVDKKKLLSPQFYQFLDRHIHFQYAGSLLKRMVSFYNYRDAYIDPEYLKACQEVRSLFFRLPEFKAYSWILYDYLKLGYTMLQGRYTGKGSLANRLAFYNFSKLVYTEPENHFRIGELVLFKNTSSYKENNYKRLLKILIDGCNVTSKKKILDDYAKQFPMAESKRYYMFSPRTFRYSSPTDTRRFQINIAAPKWKYDLDSTKNISLENYLGDYLLLHIGLVKNLEVAKSDIQEIKGNKKEPIKTLSIVVTRDSSQMNQFLDEVIYIPPNEMLSLRDSFHISNNANYFYLIDPDGKIITTPYNANSFKKLSSVITSLPNPNETKLWQPSSIFWQNLGITALILLLFAAIYIQRKRTLAKKEQQKRQLVELELKGIRAQMNPHFLFNALSSIQNLIRKKEEVAADRYLTQFAGLVRKILRNSEQEFITLEEEMAAIKQYCSLEALRTPFEYEINIAEDIDGFNTYIPGMLLQPLIENAILHGLMPQKGAKNLWINIQSHPQGLACEIIDNGIGIHQAKQQQQRHKAHQKSFGMALIRQRIQLLIGQEGTDFLKIQDRSELNPTTTGTIVNLIIPIEK